MILIIFKKKYKILNQMFEEWEEITILICESQNIAKKAEILTKIYILRYKS